MSFQCAQSASALRARCAQSGKPHFPFPNAHCDSGGASGSGSVMAPRVIVRHPPERGTAIGLRVGTGAFRPDPASERRLALKRTRLQMVATVGSLAAL